MWPGRNPCLRRDITPPSMRERLPSSMIVSIWENRLVTLTGGKSEACPYLCRPQTATETAPGSFDRAGLQNTGVKRERGGREPVRGSTQCEDGF